MGRIVLDNGATELGIGLAADDDNGDPLRTGMAKLKQWAVDINAMTAELYRPRGVPRLVTPVLPNAVPFFEDFFATSIGNAGFASGATATPDTLTNLGPLGNPAWIATEIGATDGFIGNHNNVTQYIRGIGYIQVNTGTSANALMILEPGGDTDQGGCFHSLFVPDAMSSIGMFRILSPATQLTNANYGVGWCPFTMVQGTNWLTDPNTAFSGKAGLVFTRHSAGYGGGTAGALVARIYDSAGVFNSSAEIVTTPVQNTWYKIEAFMDGAAQQVKIYVNETLAATFPLTGLVTAVSGRPCIIQQTTAAAKRVLSVDCYYQEFETTGYVR